MLGASCSLEVSEMVLTEHRNPEQMKESMASVSSKDTSTTGVSTKSVMAEWRSCSAFSLIQKRSNPHSPVKVGSICCWHFPVNQGKCVFMNEVLCWPGASKSINLVPNLHTRITRFNVHHRFRDDHVLRCNTTWKGPPTHYVVTVEGLGDSLPSSQSIMPHHIDGMAGEQLKE